jgi:hypothetical protein
MHFSFPIRNHAPAFFGHRQIAAAGEGGHGRPIFSPIGPKVKPLELGPV